MLGFWFDDCPSRELLALRRAWRDHYIAKGCNQSKASELARRKTHTWPAA